jgi:hypothetical protein
LLGQLSEQIGGSIPFACQDGAATKAAYRFLSNERISEEKIVAGHFFCTRERVGAVRHSPVLVLHDTTEFIYRREEPHAIGIVHKQQTRYDSRPRYHTTSGVVMHSSLVVTQEGLPLGLAAIKFWTRDKFNGANALKRRINPTRVDASCSFCLDGTAQFGRLDLEPQPSHSCSAHLGGAEVIPAGKDGSNFENGCRLFSFGHRLRLS